MRPQGHKESDTTERLSTFLGYELSHFFAVKTFFWGGSGGTPLVIQLLRLLASKAGGCVYDPWLRNYDPICLRLQPKKQKKF